MAARALGPGFYDRPVLDVAADLLGARITHNSVSIRLTEVEAYDGEGDPGSHAYRGLTQRTRVMFGPPGRLYVYFTYGMHFCANLVCGPDGTACAVLLRAGEVTAGADEALRRRTRPGARPPAPRDLARGPARLAQALGLHREHNGADITGVSDIVVHPAIRPVDSALVRTGPRVGVSGDGGNGLRYPWRYWIEGEPSVSAYRPAVQRHRGPRRITRPASS